ncbi:Regulator of chromosome condensation (RCC1) repeat protein [compost metagenome]
MSDAIPVQMGTVSTWDKISTGAYHSIAIRSDGKLWTWGENPEGELGDGTLVNKSTPVQIGSVANWVQISAGKYQNLILRG